MDRKSGSSISSQQALAVGTNAGVTATIASTGANKRLQCDRIDASGDAAALVTIESPASTVLWRKRYAAAFVLSEPFAADQVVGAVGQALLVKVSASTSNSEAGIYGSELRG